MFEALFPGVLEAIKKFQDEQDKSPNAEPESQLASA